MNSTADHSFAPYVRSVLRIIAGFTFSLHGMQKLLGLFGGTRFPLSDIHGVAGVIETVGGILIILGLFTRPVAFILCGEMATAYFMVHFRRGFWPVRNGGELAVLYCFIYLYLFTAGAGAWSLDALLKRRKGEAGQG